MAQLKRFFIALLPPPEMQDYANQVRQYFADRYASRKAFNSPPHITLQPPFEWNLSQRQNLIDSLSRFAQTQSTIPVTLSGFGAFPPRVIFINVVRSPELLTLQQRLAQHCATDLGIVDQYADRRFAPHMTVAFRDLSPANFQQAWSEFAHQPLALTNAAAQQYTFQVTALTLLQHDGRLWQVDQPIGLSP